MSFLVSILVLMELPLQLNIIYQDQERYLPSFNPCFNGTTSATLYHVVSVNIVEVVSILVLMELPLQQGLYMGGRAPYGLFQSLF